MVHNVHERIIQGPVTEVGALIDSLSNEQDALWPKHEWPAMRLNLPLSLGAAGGHGPVRYLVTQYHPGRLVRFQFSGPAGFHGHHAFVAIELTQSVTLLRHEMTLNPAGIARISWPFFFRSLHNSLVEESLDLAENAFSSAADVKHRRSLWTRILRAAFMSPKFSARIYSKGLNPPGSGKD